MKKTGTLYIVATPIGNMEDFTLRAIRILKEEINYVYCEDTRETRKLLNRFGITAPTISLHAYSSPQKIDEAVHRMIAGESIAYCTDSGTPAVSDPGSALVQSARKNGVPVVPLPGPSALTTIISVSGFPEKNIIFAGFINKKEGKQRRELEQLKKYPGIIVLYESPYRIRKILKPIAEIFPDAPVIIGREMSKIHEEFISGTATELYARADTIKEKGEFVIAIHNQ